VIEDEVEIGAATEIGAHCVLGRGARIWANTAAYILA
jgi:UDP-3-O-[3-hydroxymyristoyl] glucosamine N-acyltransferase